VNRKKSLLLFFILLFFLNVPLLKAQIVQKEKLPLTAVLAELENQYNISFSYADKTIKGKSTIVPPKDMPLVDVLRFLKKETKLDFELFAILYLISTKITNYKDDNILCVKLLQNKSNYTRLQIPP
jgi:hypothetical protein